MLSLNLTNILYLAFRLGPFILVCYFVLLSLFSQDFRAIIYLSGLIFSCFIVILIGNLSSNSKTDAPFICNQITLSGSEPLSVLPLSTVVYCFTFFYLIMAMFLPALKNVETKDSNLSSLAIASNNVGVLILFPMLIVLDFLWLLFYNCASFFQIFGSIFWGTAFGVLWAYIISQSSMSQLLYMTVMSNAQICSRPSKQKLKCVKTNKSQKQT